MADIAVLGVGILGTEVLDLLELEAKITDHISEILEDPDIRIVVEAIGGKGIAYDLTRQLLNSGRHVVTANETLIAAHGEELLALAATKHVQYLFEASVADGIPIIRMLRQCLSANERMRITGILNGTVNEILIRMHDGKTFQAALQEVHSSDSEKPDLSDDSDGHDSARMLVILSALANKGSLPLEKIHTEGIRDIVSLDIQAVKALGGKIRLLAESCYDGNQMMARVGPAMLFPDSPLANVGHVRHAILIEGDAIGEVMFIGRRTGKLPAASTIVADIMDIVRDPDFCSAHSWKLVRSFDPVLWMDVSAEMLVRIQTGESVENTQIAVKTLFPEANPIAFDSERPDMLVFLTGEGKEESLRLKLARLDRQIRLSDTDPGCTEQSGVQRVLRVWKGESCRDVRGSG